MHMHKAIQIASLCFSLSQLLTINAVTLSAYHYRRRSLRFSPSQQLTATPEVHKSHAYQFEKKKKGNGTIERGGRLSDGDGLNIGGVLFFSISGDLPCNFTGNMANNKAAVLNISHGHEEEAHLFLTFEGYWEMDTHMTYSCNKA
ncbi:hypothetical protein E3N88_34418 [Mikania micrantha]|uniref:Uncharacterized protein n=1 Tax=Mikania micrantha TaxID=192012 RepID=A0A5N6LY82_9ASTR|nr:hypothetical protein E3N88_34418 [Mikania micrantha]